MVILYILLVLVAVILARTLMFTPKKTEDRERPPVEQDRDASIRNLAELIKCKTVSYYDASLEDDAEFEKLVGKLPELYPNVCRTCTLQRFDGRGLPTGAGCCFAGRERARARPRSSWRTTTWSRSRRSTGPGPPLRPLSRTA